MRREVARADGVDVGRRTEHRDGQELIAARDVNARSVVNNWERQVTAEPRAIYRPAGGLTPLLFAAREGCVECATLLIDAGANIDLADPEGISPLLMAVINMQFDLAASLIRRGASPNKWDFWGRAPLYAAVDLNTIPRGGRPDRPSLDKTTSADVVGMLLEAGANPRPVEAVAAVPQNRATIAASMHADDGRDAALAGGKGARRSGRSPAARTCADGRWRTRAASRR